MHAIMEFIQIDGYINVYIHDVIGNLAEIFTTFIYYYICYKYRCQSYLIDKHQFTLYVNNYIYT
jgi:hypothetical protein